MRTFGWRTNDHNQSKDQVSNIIFQYVKNVVGLSQLFSSTYSAKFHVSLNFITNISNPSWNPHQ